MGEKAAAAYLRRAGFRILARNYACPLGEIDLIGETDDTIVFVEVKTRTDDAPSAPEGNINLGKQRRLTRAARHWLSSHDQPDRAYRFDAVSVVLAPDGRADVRHIEEAFVPDEPS